MRLERAQAALVAVYACVGGVLLWWAVTHAVVAAIFLSPADTGQILEATAVL